MNSLDNIKKQLKPILIGVPWVIFFIGMSLFVGNQFISYSPNIYQSIAKIKLEDQKQGFTNNKLYQTQDRFSAENRIQTETEMLKSHAIISRALDSLYLDISVTRVGKIKNTELYKNCPFILSYELDDRSFYDREIEVTIKDSLIVLSFQEPNGSTTTVTGELCQVINIGKNTLQFNRNSDLLISQNIALSGKYKIIIHSKESLINLVSSKLDVKAMDKEIAVIRVVYKDKMPLRTAELANAICKAYIQDYIQAKSKSANKTSHFIDEKLKEVGKALIQSEVELEAYKLNHGIVNILQETETGLREISKIKLQLMNLEMHEREILALEEYINSGDYFYETAINFGYGDLLMTELVKKLKLWSDEKKDLLLKYTPNSDQIQTVDNKIEEVKSYIIEGIKTSRQSIEIKRKNIEVSLEKSNRQLDDIPVIERQLQILNRNFKLQESVFDFLSKKKIESSITASSFISFHRIIQTAQVPKGPISPNRKLIHFVSGALGLFLGIVFIYIKKYVFAKIHDKEDVEKCSTLPVIGIARHVKGDKLSEFGKLAKVLVLKNQLVPNSIICITSAIAKDGRSTVAFYLSKALVGLGYSVCLLRTNIENSINPINIWPSKNSGDIDLQNFKQVIINRDFVGIDELLKEKKEAFDFVFLDSPPAILCVEAIQMMKKSDFVFYLMRAGKTQMKYAYFPDLLKEEYGLKNISILLNDFSGNANYSGDFHGGNFSERREKRNGFIHWIKNIKR